MRLLRASMGPQLDSCGRNSLLYTDPAAYALQWGRNLTVAEGGLWCGSGGSGSVLQWGRNLTVAEGGDGGPPCGGRCASMGPQLDSCGRATSRRAFLPRVRASMGPQLDSCGRRDVAEKQGDLNLLQWGRNLTVAEGRPPPSKTAPYGFASMGPQLDSCGRRNNDYANLAFVHASMGPQLDSCGRDAPCPKARAGPRLQWGRNLTVAEGRAAAPG